MRLELTVLGTASQAPTRERGQGGYVLRWFDEVVLFDPGEGSQRQLLLAKMSPAQIDRVFITHFHGDHCLGLPGLLQSRALSTDRPITVHYPSSGESYVDHLLGGCAIDFDLRVHRVPIEAGHRLQTTRYVVSTAELDHPTPAIGYRLEEPAGRHLLPDRLATAGLEGESIAQLRRAGRIRSRTGTIDVRSVSEIRQGPSMAYVMDTALGDGARHLAFGVDLLICEATYLSSEAHLAAGHGHMTAAQAGQLAADAGVGLLVIGHYSARYDDIAAFADEARRYFPRVIAARDFTCIPWLTRAT